jgi:hypothetical protein
MKECCALVPGSPNTTGPVARGTGAPSARHALAEAFHLELLQMRGQPRQALVIGQHGARG